MTGKPDLTTSFTNFLRKSSKLPCRYSGCEEHVPDIDDRIKAHLQERHGDLLHSKDTDFTRLVQEWRGRAQGTTGRASGNQSTSPTIAQESKPSGPQDKLKQDSTVDQFSLDRSRPQKPQEATHAGTPNLSRARSLSPPRRSKARAATGPAHDPAFSRRAPQPIGKKLWNPGEPQQAASSVKQKLPAKHSNRRETRNPPAQESPADDDQTITLIKQPETRPISQEQLIAEVKGIYAGLVMVESKCIEVDNAQSSQSDAKLNNDQWQALIALHRTLLHEHHDFFLASQHPSASQALRRLASKYAMPARMWRHGIHSFLELLRHRLPASLEHMLTFIYLAYSMMALLYETVPAFEDTWIECLGDLGRYRMAIEDDDIRDREVWTSVSRHWYSRASDKAPTTGRLYHHLAILARPNALQQLFYYNKSLCVPIPFTSARESIMTLFDPILGAGNTQHPRLSAIDAAFVKAHGILFSGKQTDDFPSAVEEFLNNLNNHIGRTTRRWMESGYYIGIANCSALLSYGKDDNLIYKAIRPQRTEEPTDVSMGDLDQNPGEPFLQALRLAEGTYNVVFHRFADPNVLSYFHVVLVFMHHLTSFRGAMALVDKTFPWKLVSLLLNSLLLSYREYDRIESESFPRLEKGLPRPLPEDFAMKGLLWVDKYFPPDWFSNEEIDDDEKYFEVASMTDERKERILWLACQISSIGNWLTYDKQLHQFGVVQEYESEIEAVSHGKDDTDMINVSETSDSLSGRSTMTSSVRLHQADDIMVDVQDVDRDFTTSAPFVSD